MAYNTLLTYLSELQQGSWTQFKRACQELWKTDDDGRDHAALASRALSVLGHLEIAWDARPAWSIAAPVLVILPRRESPSAVLCGYRPPQLIQQLKSFEASFQILVTPQAEGPDIVQVAASTRSQLHELAQRLEVTLAEHVVEQIVLCLPNLLQLLERLEERPLPAVPPIRRFDTESLSWVNTSGYSGDGLYELEQFVPEFRLLHGTTCKKVEREVGVYAVIRKEHWSYDADTHTLLIPRGLLPPPLYQRALVLCSGQLASYNWQRSGWEYVHIPPAIAQMLASKLGQSLEESKYGAH